MKRFAAFHQAPRSEARCERARVPGESVRRHPRECERQERRGAEVVKESRQDFSLVGVGRRMMVFGPRLGTTQANANVCLMGTRRAITAVVKYFAWDDAKNAKLRKQRRIGFEEVVFHIERGELLDILQHPNPDRYAGQRIFVIQRYEYFYLVPFVEDEHVVFQEMVIPSQKATRQYPR